MTVRLFLGSLLLLAAQAPAIVAQDASSPPEGNSWALLIGAQDYAQASKLSYIVNDVRQLADTLLRYGGYERARVEQITDEGTPESQPTKAALERAIPRFLARVKAGDHVLIYFSGHGFRAEDGRLFLAPLDCDPKRPAETGVSASWLREQLEACPGAVKLLILDSCHAGTEKGDATTENVATKSLAEIFAKTAGVITLASSQEDEKSQVWQFKKQSLFSYWLKEGLKGHADKDANGAIDIDELFEYVHARVTLTAEVRFDRPQTPSRSVGTRIAGVPVVVRLRPQPLKQVVADMADQLAGLMEERQVPSVAIMEFTSETLSGEVLGGPFGLLGKLCSDQLQRQLEDRCLGKFSVVGKERLQAALRAEQFSVDDLGSGQRLAALASQGGGFPVLVRGSLYERKGNLLHLRCKLVETSGERTLGYVGGVAALNVSEWAMQGHSVQLASPGDVSPGPGEPPIPPPPPPSLSPAPAVSPSAQLIAQADQKSREAHPLSDPNFPLRIRILVNGRERQPVFRSNQAYVQVAKGEKYEVRVENRLTGAGGMSKRALLRLLVDGLNTLPEPDDDKGIAQMIVGKRVNLDEAKYWCLNPDDNSYRPGGIPTWAIPGYAASTGLQGKTRDFEVVDAAESLAARRKFTEQIGLITAAFYEPKLARGDLGTLPGKERDAIIRRCEDVEPGRLIAVLHLHYASRIPPAN
jgi:uncharacterized caspase-like protein